MATPIISAISASHTGHYAVLTWLNSTYAAYIWDYRQEERPFCLDDEQWSWDQDEPKQPFNFKPFRWWWRFVLHHPPLGREIFGKTNLYWFNWTLDGGKYYKIVIRVSVDGRKSLSLNHRVISFVTPAHCHVRISYIHPSDLFLNPALRFHSLCVQNPSNVL